MSTGSASLDRRRMLAYQRLAAAFTYPDEGFFAVFPELESQKDRLQRDYDRLFRALEIWLYGTEHLARSEFQKSNYLSDIMGFYRAFGLEPSLDRADSLSCLLEFMHVLIFKTLAASERGNASDQAERIDICRQAQSKFFREYVFPSGEKIARSVLEKSDNGFYGAICREMLGFMEKEKLRFGEKR